MDIWLRSLPAEEQRLDHLVPRAPHDPNSKIRLSISPDGVNLRYRRGPSVRRLQSFPSAVTAWFSSVGVRVRLAPAAQQRVDGFGRTELVPCHSLIVKPPPAELVVRSGIVCIRTTTWTRRVYG